MIKSPRYAGVFYYNQLAAKVLPATVVKSYVIFTFFESIGTNPFEMRTFFVSLSFITSNICFSQLDSLKGKIKWIKDSVIETDKSYLLLSSEGFGQFILREDDIFTEFKGDLLPKRYMQYDKERQFDEKGRLIKITNIFPKIGSSSCIHYSYDEFNNLVQKRSEYSDSEYAITNYHYQPLKRGGALYLSSEITYENDPGRFFMTQYYYTDKSLLLGKSEYSVFENEMTNYSYDKAGNLLEEIWTQIKKVIKYDSMLKREVVADSVSWSYSRFYNYYAGGGLQQKLEGCSPDFVPAACQRTVYVYDEKGRKSKIYYYWMHQDSLFSHKEYEYYPDNCIKKINWFFKEESQPKSYIEYFYRDNELTKAILVNPYHNKVVELEYKFDSHRNWIEQKKIVNNDLFYTRKREIVYWD